MPPQLQLPHIYFPGDPKSAPFTPVKSYIPGEDRPILTARQNRYLHAKKLTEEVEEAVHERVERIKTLQISEEESVPGICLEVEGSTLHPFDVDSLENRRSPTAPIELLNVRIIDTDLKATIFVPVKRLDSLKKRIAKYGDVSIDPEGTRSSTISIDSVKAFKLADLNSFWMEERAMPENKDTQYMWEAWLRKGAIDALRSKADKLKIKLSKHSLKFHECEICLLTCSLNTLALLQIIESPLVAFRYREEVLPSFFTFGTPAEQMNWVEKLEKRLQLA